MRRMHSSDDLCCSHTLGDASVPLVHETHDITSRGTFGGHDGYLGARVDERFDRMAVDFDGDVEHVHTAKGCFCS